MDPRKQKRLGPAPIASFEKSFEDTTSLTTSTTSTSQHAVSAATASTTQIASHNNVIGDTQGIYEKDKDAKDFYGNGGDTTNMDINDSGKTCKKSITTKTTATTKMAATPARAEAAVVGGSTQLTDPSVGGGGGGFETTTGNSKIKQDISSNTNNASSNNNNRTVTTTTTTGKRAPPLKTATNTSTLVSSQCSFGGGDFKGATSLCTPSTPRIELSRASSSSHHEEDSRESSPENVFEQVGTGTLQETLDMGFREEGALELRSSTEELYFMDPAQKKEEEAKLQQHQQQQQQLQQQTKRASPHMFKIEDHQTYLQQHQRKDSASSEVAALLCISGRTSRISSVGSQGSAVSRLSAVSGISRSPSPHRMLLETSFCGPKPLESLTDGTVGNLVEQPTVALLEQVLLARTRDTTQAIFAEGIKVESSPKKKPPTSLTNGDAKLTAKIKAQNRPDTGTIHKTTMGAQRKSTKSPGQMIVGKTPSGTEYIRINLKPDCMYDDKGIAPHEKVVEAPNSLAPVYATKTQTKPASLSLQQKSKADNLLTPTASPKPTRKDKDSHGSRSPSPNTVSVSRKSSFSSLFRFGGGKDSPDSPRDRSRPRSKSKERGQTPQSQTATPNKQKSVLAIFKPGKRGSSTGVEGTKTSKSSSPTDAHEMQQLQPRSKSHTPIMTATGSRPNSSLKYYEDPVEGYIHIPLHTPPEEKETRKLFQSIQQLNAEPIRPQATAITMSDLATAVKKLKPVGARKNSGSGLAHITTAPKPPPPPPKRIENLDAIHSLPQDDNDKERTWSLEVNKHSSQDSQDTVGSGESYASAIRVTTQRSQLAEVKEHVVHENGVEAEAEIHRLPSQESTTSQAEIRVVETKATINSSAPNDDNTTAAAKERRRLMFATRVGSGSQEQIFATQFSISKTESISSHMSEHTQDTLSESTTENLKRQNTVIKKSPEDVVQPPPPPPPQKEKKEPFKRQPQAIAQIEEQREIFHMSITKESLQKTKEALRESKEKHIIARKKSISTSEDEKPKPGPPVVMRRKPSGGSAGGEDKQRQHQSRSTSEDDNEVAVTNHRHSRYLENFDVRKKYHENVQGATRKPRKQSGGQEFNPPDIKQQQLMQEQAMTKEQYQRKPQPQLPQPPPPSTEPSPLHTPSPSVQDAAQSSPGSSHHRSEPRSQSQSPVDKARQTPPKPPRTSTPTRRSQAGSPNTSKSSPIQNATPQHTVTKKYHTHVDRSSVLSTDEPVESSESERDSDLATVESKRRHLALNVGCIEDHESTGLVSQESFDDELPYIPTTLPEEKALGVNIIPMKERANMELKTCPLDRPRSTTPLNPSHLEEYIGGKTVNTPESPFELTGSSLVRGEKLRISLPRKDSKKDVQSSKSPRRISNASGKSWFEFAEEGLRATAHLERKDSNKQLLQQKPPPPPLPPSTNQLPKKQTTPAKPKTPTLSKPPVTTPKASTQRKLSGHWIDFENIPEKRKPPKKITTLPRDSVSSTAHATQSRSTLGRNISSTTATTTTCTKSHAFSQQHKHHHHQHQPDVTASAMSTTDGGMPHYNYVKPEDCQCECHESKTKEAHSSSATDTTTTTTAATTPPTTNNNNNNKAQGVDLLPKGEDMLPLLSQDSHEGIEPSDSSREYSCYTDDEMDLPTRSSSRSKSSSSKLDEFPRRDAAHSPRNRKFPDK